MKDLNAAGLPQDDELERLGGAMRSLRAKAVDGGPPVDYSLVVAYADGMLDEKQTQAMDRLVIRYRAWHDAYREVLLSGGDPTMSEV